MRLWDHLSYAITQYLLPAMRQRWFLRFCPGVLLVLIYRPWKDERLSWPQHREWTVCSEPLRDDITGANCSVITPHWAGVCERLAQGHYRAAEVIGVGDGGHVLPKIREKIFFGQLLCKIRAFSGKNRVKFGNFVKFSSKYNKNSGIW